jgi:hypothetical protein
VANGFTRTIVPSEPSWQINGRLMPPEVAIMSHFAVKSFGNLIWSLPYELIGWAGVKTSSISVTSCTSTEAECGTRLIRLKLPGVGVYFTP